MQIFESTPLNRVQLSWNALNGAVHKRRHHFFWDFWPLPRCHHFYWIRFISKINIWQNPLPSDWWCLLWMALRKSNKKIDSFLLMSPSFLISDKSYSKSKLRIFESFNRQHRFRACSHFLLLLQIKSILSILLSFISILWFAENLFTILQMKHVFRLSILERIRRASSIEIEWNYLYFWWFYATKL